MEQSLKAAISTAFCCSTGEYAWRRPHVISALYSIAESGLAVLGGEAWVIMEGEIRGVIPDAEGEMRIWSWNTRPAKVGESWDRFCGRTRDESLHAIEDMGVEDRVGPEIRPHIFYQLTFVEKNEIGSGPTAGGDIEPAFSEPFRKRPEPCKTCPVGQGKIAWEAYSLGRTPVQIFP